MVVLSDLNIPKWLFVPFLVLVLLSFWIRSKLTYWKRKKVPHLQPTFPWGNLENLLTNAKCVGRIYQNFYNEMKQRGMKYAGFYTFMQPVFVPIEPECIKQILIKDFSSFHARGFYNNEKDQPMSASIFTVDGPRWRTVRYKFSPTFSSGKIKFMFNLMEECVQPLLGTISKCAENKQVINMKDIMSRYTTDTIGSCAFGINCNSFSDNSEMHEMVTSCMRESTKFVRFTALHTFPNLCRFLKRGLFINKPLEFVADVITDSFEQRKKNFVYRTDLLQVLKDMQEKRNNEDFDVTLDEIRAQCFLFFLAGYETTSTALSYLFFELAENLEIQDKLREEIIKVTREHGKISYDSLQEMKYLQRVIDETLRKYPPLTVVNRTCTENYELPNGEILEKGTNVIVPVLGVHRDPEYYPNPDVFDPNRFSEENQAKRPPYTYLPFGDGPRNCIGARFALIQMKLVVSNLLTKFRFTLNKNMDPTRRYTTHFILTLEQDIMLDVEKM